LMPAKHLLRWAMNVPSKINNFSEDNTKYKTLTSKTYRLLQTLTGGTYMVIPVIRKFLAKKIN
jgi:hypothetical protein